MTRWMTCVVMVCVASGCLTPVRDTSLGSADAGGDGGTGTGGGTSTGGGTGGGTGMGGGTELDAGATTDELSVEWVAQFGSNLDDRAYSVAVDASGNVFVAGTTQSFDPLFTGPGVGLFFGVGPAFVRKYDSKGAHVWTRQFGPTTITSADAHAVAVDTSGNVFVAGATSGTLPGQAKLGDPSDRDAFVQKHDPEGAILWTRQFGSIDSDTATAVAVDSAGFVYVVGQTHGALPGQTTIGQTDSFLRKYDSLGAEVWTRQFGDNGDDQALSVSVGPSGDVFVAGKTAWVPASGLAWQGRFEAFVRRYDANGALIWSQEFGEGLYPSATTVAATASGQVVVAGFVLGALPGETALGDKDAFVRQYDATGALVWSRQFGSEVDDEAYGVAVDVSGSVFVAGEIKSPVAHGRGFARSFDAAGSPRGTYDLEGAGRAITTAGSDELVISGFTSGILQGATPPLGGQLDAFVIRLLR